MAVLILGILILTLILDTILVFPPERAVGSSTSFTVSSTKVESGVNGWVVSTLFFGLAIGLTSFI